MSADRNGREHDRNGRFLPKVAEATAQGVKEVVLVPVIAVQTFVVVLVNREPSVPREEPSTGAKIGAAIGEGTAAVCKGVFDGVKKLFT